MSRPELPGARPLWSPGDPAVGLYLHVPFCRAICTYCAFAKGEYAADRADFWLESLGAEIRTRAGGTWEGRPLLDTLFLGGGTPSTLSPDQWRRLGDLLDAGFERAPEIEFTSEANPESFTRATAEAMRGIGVNRVSLGVQSLDPEELHLLGRVHGVREVEEAVGVARAAGLRSVNLDLMYGLPGQTAGGFSRSLQGVLHLGPDHLSAYCLGLEPGTRLAAGVEAGAIASPEDETARELYEILVARTETAGLGLYEISNFARPGHRCRHNLRYWTRDAVIGLGPSAHAFLAGHRWANPAPLETWARAYAEGPSPVPRPVPPKLARFEWTFLHLRLVEGLSKREFAATWHREFDSVYREVSRPLVEAGLLVDEGERVRLAAAARFVSDAVFAEFAPG